MGFRFRRSVKLFPGVRLNFSGGGISTTVGVRGASLNFGRHGTTANVGIPGTGLSYRTKIAPAPHAYPPAFSRPVPPPPSAPFVPQPLTPVPVNMPAHVEGEIRSAPIEVLTSPGLGELKRLINEARVQRIALTRSASEMQQQLDAAERRLKTAQTFLVRLVTQRGIPALAKTAFDANLSLNATQDRLEGCTVDIDFAFGSVVLDKYAALLRAYENLRSGNIVWDVTASVAIDRLKARTTATQAVTRTPVRFDFAQSDIVSSKYQALRLANLNGYDIRIYPGFVMMHGDAQDFALIDVRELKVTYADSRFIEEQQVPADAETVGSAWKKANKDGSPDRRFNSNYQIPIVRYGELSFTSATGMMEVYQISNWQNARNFALATLDYQSALSTDERNSQTLPTPHAEETAEPKSDEGGAQMPTFQPPPPPNLLPDYICLAVILLALGALAVWSIV